MQNLERFTVPKDFRGRSALVCQLWWLVQSSLFSMSPQFMYGWRRWLLRLFGASIGRGVIIRPSVRVTYPWKLKIEKNSWVGDFVELYTLGEINIGANAVISQRSYLCTGSHNTDSPSFEIFSKPISIGDGVWLATDVFVAPGVTIGESAVVGARSSVFKDLAGGKIYMGSPARFVRDRDFKEAV